MADDHQNYNTRKQSGTVNLRNEGKAGGGVPYTFNPNTLEQRLVDLGLRPDWSTKF